MYGWSSDDGRASTGMDSDRGYDYGSARKAYADDAASPSARRSASARAKSYKSRIGRTEAPVGKDIQTDSTHPIVVCTDVTGSMRETPGIMFEKLPLLGKEVERYAPAYATSFVAFGDVDDSYPLQVRDFASGEALDEHIAALYPEGQGGDDPEDPELVAYYLLNHCKMPNAVKPVCFFITDATCHRQVQPEDVKNFTGDTVQSALDSASLFKQLAKKFSVYVILRNYSPGSSTVEFWSDMVGAQRVKPLEEPRDIVELLIGLYAAELGELKDFELRSSRRHSDKPDRVSRVIKSVHSGGLATGASGSKAKPAGTKRSTSIRSKKLTD